MNREELIAFMKRVTPILHEPMATKVAEEWADKFVDEFKKPQGEPSDPAASAVARAIIDHDEERLTCFDHAGFCCPCGALHDATRSEWQRHQARAALRAAGGVR